MIDAQEFARLTPHLSASQRPGILPPLQAAMARFGIQSKQRESHFLCQVLHESGEFKYRRELASGAAYEGRRDLGNTQPGDGRRYKGRGWIQITGRHNYRVYGAMLGLDLVGHPEQAETNENAPLIAGAYWHSRNLNAKADRDDFLGITRAINGGTNGLASRRHYLSLARQVLSLNDPDPSDDDAELVIPLALRGLTLPFTGHLDDGTTWTALRPLADALDLIIVETDGDSASLLPDGSRIAEDVPLRIEGGRGFSPVRQVVAVAGLSCNLVNGRVEIG